jgi:hypothetical protein
MTSEGYYQVMVGDLVKYHVYQQDDPKIAVVSDIGRDKKLVVLVSLFPYREIVLWQFEYKIYKKNKEQYEKFRMGDLVRLRGGDGILYVVEIHPSSNDGGDACMLSVREINPCSIGTKTRRVNSRLLERIDI